MSEEIFYKKVNNPKRPGRAPSGHEWVRDSDGTVKTNEQGEFAYKKADPNKKKASAKKKPRGKKKTAAKRAGRKAAPELSADAKGAMLLKKTYKDFSSNELAKIRDIADGLISKARDLEKAHLDKRIEKLKAEREKLD